MAIPKPKTADDKAPSKKLRPSKTTDEERDPDQAWFWTDEWQEGERRVDQDKRSGRVKEFDNVEDFFTSLNRR